MTSPIETIADALVAFIMSLLRDPDAAEDFVASPHAMLAGNGLQGVCMADVAAVRPVVIDHPRVVHAQNDPSHSPSPAMLSDQGAVQEIVRMIQQYTMVDARSTIVDQSVNQNIWTEGGDLTQVFDQDAVLATGDHALAAGNDVSMVDSDVDVTMGDVSVGNETYDDSFNQSGEIPSDDATSDPVPDATSDTADAVDDGPAGDATAQAVGTAVDTVDGVATQAAVVSAPPADVPEPADLLEGDMTVSATELSYDADAASAAVNDQPVDLPIDDD